jgi:hypothetical protein
MKNADAPAAKREEEEESMLKPLKIVIVLAGGAIVKVKKRFAPAQRLVSGSCTIFEQHAVFVGRSRKAFAVAGFSAACSKERRQRPLRGCAEPPASAPADLPAPMTS